MVTDLIILRHDEVMRTTHELWHPPPNFLITAMEGHRASKDFKRICLSTQRVSSCTGLELKTRQPRVHDHGHEATTATSKGYTSSKGSVSELILTSHCSATLGLLATDHVILNHGQVTWTTPELAPPSPKVKGQKSCSRSVVPKLF
ncbi:hypothetical protein TNCV_3277041 [Trichonephila clavipes]|nr:hypothetical protein TNCV_3277041 [Trichonephila clavipes]